MKTQIDLNALNGQELTSVMVMTNCVRLQFAKYPLREDGRLTDEALIDIDSGFELVRQTRKVIGKVSSDRVAFREAAGHLVSLIEHRIADIRMLADRQLRISFSDNSELTLLINEHGFESYRIHASQKSVTV